MIAAFAVDQAARRVADQAVLHADVLDLRVDLERGVERLFGAAVGDELERHEKPAAADVADVGMAAETGGECRAQRVALAFHVR